MTRREHSRDPVSQKPWRSFYALRHPLFLSFSTGLLLALCYPAIRWGFLAWFAFVPLLLIISHAQNRSQALGYSLIAGVVFFGFSMHWLTNVTPVGWILLALMESVYFALFGWLAYEGIHSRRSLVFRIIWIGLAWTATEIFRSEMPVFGFGWNLLAYSQASYPVMIQSANIFGAYGVGFLIVLVNNCIFELLAPKKIRKRGVSAALFTAVLLMLGAMLFYGDRILAQEKKPEEYLRVSVLQGNIPQSVKWQVMAKEKILEIYGKLTQLAALEQPDLIVWPEASFPGYFNQDIQAGQVSSLAQEVGTPLLVGGLHWVDDDEVYNSAYALAKDGAWVQRYDKLRLVPFGEYIPFRVLLGWLTPVADALGISNFSAGKDPVIFRWAREEWPFGVLICFEDVFMDLARTLADRDAKFLIVITNDAWFGKTGAPFQHLQASIFRAVENGVAVVRAANTGVSAFISHQGRVLATVKNARGDETFVMGQRTVDLPLIAERTLYRRGGYLFPQIVLVCFLFCGILIFRRTRKA